MSDSILRTTLIVLCVAGLLVSGYLAYVYLADADALCSGVGGCDAVKDSRYAAVAGIPVPVLGLAGYAAILAVVLLETSSGFLGEHSRILAFGFSLFGTLYSAYLTYLELAVIKAVCPYCVASAVIMTVIFAVALARLVKDLRSVQEYA